MGVPVIFDYGESCPYGCRARVVRRGWFYRANGHKRIQRYRCDNCRRSFSDATKEVCYRQKRRDLNPQIFRLLTGGYSQRRAALDLKINRKTVVRKFLFLGRWAEYLLRETNLLQAPVNTMEFDDLETSEHTKCKPVSVTMAIEFKTRRILGFRVASMPAKGRLAKIARKKYGKRLDERPRKRDELFEELKPLLSETCLIKSDESPHYPASVAKHFPGSRHERFKGKRGCIGGLGELKKTGFDPLFTLNHTYAMLRANINRLFRRTWCTTKKKERLALHIAIYSLRHNLDLI